MSTQEETPKQDHRLSKEEIELTFQKLGLYDPVLRQRLLDFSKLSDDEPQHWTLTDSKTSDLDHFLRDAELERDSA